MSPASDAVLVQPFEALLADLLAELVGTPSSDLDRAIVRALGQICALLGADRSTLWQTTPEANDRLSLTHVHIAAAGSPPLPDPGIRADDVFPWTASEMLAGRVVAVSDVDDFPPEAVVDRASFLRFAGRSTLAIPFGVADPGALRGAITFAAISQRRVWPEAVIARCRLIAEALHSVLARQRADEAELEERTRLRAMVDSTTTDFIWCVDAERHGLLAWNRALADYFFRQHGIAIFPGARPEEILPGGAAAAEAWHAHYVRALRDGPFSTQYRAFGSDSVLQFQLNPLARDGVPVGVAVFGRDITRRLRTEAALRHSEGRLRLVIDTSPDGIFTVERGRVALMNAAAARLLGESAEAVVGRACVELYAPASRGEAEAQLAEAAVGQPARARRLKLQGAEARAVECRAVGLLIGSAPAVLVMWHDVTERERLEAQYRQAQKMEAVGRLAAGVAHDINNQLTVIQGYSSCLLEDVAETDALWEPLHEIFTATQRAQSTTGHLLAFSRRQLLEPETIDPARFLSDLRRPVARLVGEDVALEVELAPDLPRVSVDPSALHQALMNLIVNARDAMPAGGRLTLRASRLVRPPGAGDLPDVPPGDYVVFETEDTGAGIDAALHERIFEPFFTTKEAGKGTGLGLPMVLGFTRQSRGHLDPRSRPGEGTTVRLLLPAVLGDADTAAPRPAPTPTTEATDALVLVVEDEANVRDLVASMLRRGGFDVVTAAGPDQALALADAGARFDLVLTDMVMPGLRGDTLGERLLAAGVTRRLLFMTGYVDEAPRIEGGLLRKPFTAAELLSRVHAALAAPL